MKLSMVHVHVHASAQSSMDCLGHFYTKAGPLTTTKKAALKVFGASITVHLNSVWKMLACKFVIKSEMVSVDGCSFC